MILDALAAFAAPENISANAKSFLWLVPLVTATAIVYKALKLKHIRPAAFVKEVAVLTGTILVFMIVVAAGLYLVSWLVTE